jgi:hypothetical protein
MSWHAAAGADHAARIGNRLTLPPGRPIRRPTPGARTAAACAPACGAAAAPLGPARRARAHLSRVERAVDHEQCADLPWHRPVVDGQLEEVIRPRPVDLLVHPHATSVVFYRRAAEGRRSRTGRSAESGSNCEARGVVRSGRTVTRLRPEVDVAGGR